MCAKKTNSRETNNINRQPSLCSIIGKGLASIKYFYKENKLVFFLGIACLYIIIGNGIIDWFFIKTSMSSERIEAINNMWTGLAYSYLAGLIFYYFITYLPNKKKEGEAKEIIKLIINNMYADFFYTVIKLNPSSVKDLNDISLFFKNKAFIKERLSKNCICDMEPNIEDNITFKNRTYIINDTLPIMNDLCALLRVGSELLIKYETFLNTEQKRIMINICSSSMLINNTIPNLVNRNITKVEESIIDLITQLSNDLYTSVDNLRTSLA